MELRELRKRYGLSRKELSDMYGIPYRTIDNWERGINKCPEYLMNLLTDNLTNREEAKMMNELVGKEMSFIKLDNEMEKLGFCTIFDEVGDFDELYESGCVIYGTEEEEDAAYITFDKVRVSEDGPENNIIRVTSVSMDY